MDRELEKYLAAGVAQGDDEDEIRQLYWDRQAVIREVEELRAEVKRLRITPDYLDDMLGLDPNDPLQKVASHAVEFRKRAEKAEAKLAKVRAYAKEREEYARWGRTVHSARIASDLLAILDEERR